MSSSAHRRAARRREEKSQDQEFKDSITTYKIVDRDTMTSVECSQSLCPYCMIDATTKKDKKENKIMNARSFIWVDDNNFICTKCLRYKATSDFMVKYTSNILNEMEKVWKYPDELIPSVYQNLRENNSEEINWLEYLIETAAEELSVTMISSLNLLLTDVRLTEMYKSLPKSMPDKERLVYTLYTIHHHAHWMHTRNNKDNVELWIDEMQEFVKSGKI
jgi:hypothetical protein